MHVLKAASRRGFSLIEVLIAVGVISVALLGVLSVFAFGVRAQHTGGRTTEAINYCRELMEVIRLQNLAFQSWGTTGALPGSGSGVNDADDTVRRPIEEPFSGNQPVPPNTNFTRNIRIKKLATSGYQSNVVIISVKVFWADRGKEREVQLQAFARNQ